MGLPRWYPSELIMLSFYIGNYPGRNNLGHRNYPNCLNVGTLKHPWGLAWARHQAQLFLKATQYASVSPGKLLGNREYGAFL